MTAKKKGDSLTIEGKLKAALVPEAAQPDPIPENWVWTRITALADQRRGVSYNKSDASSQPVENSILVLRGGNIQHGEFQIGDDCVYVPNDYVSASQILQIGDVIIVASSGSKSLVGKAAQVKDQMPDTSFGAFLTLFRPYQPIDAKYFGWFFQSRYYRNAISEASIGININNLRREHFEALIFPLPPLSEQQRISDKLESLLGKIKEAKALLDEIPEILQNFRQTVLSAACSGRLTEDWRNDNSNVTPANRLLSLILAERKKKWENAALTKLKAQGKTPKDDKWKKSYNEPVAVDPSDLANLLHSELPETWIWTSADQLNSTITDGEHITPKRSETGIYLLSARNIQNGWISFENVDYISQKIHEILKQRLSIEEGDVLMSCSGSLGRSCVAPKEPEFSLVRSVAVLKPVLSMGHYLAYLIRSPFVQSQIDNKKTQTAQANIFQNKIRTLIFPLAPLEEQKEIVRRVESLFGKADDFETQYKAAMELIESLPGIILSKAFRGELLPQDPNDEPASVLLRRIIETLDKKEPIEIHRKSFGLDARNKMNYKEMIACVIK